MCGGIAMSSARGIQIDSLNDERGYLSQPADSPRERAMSVLNVGFASSPRHGYSKQQVEVREKSTAKTTESLHFPAVLKSSITFPPPHGHQDVAGSYLPSPPKNILLREVMKIFPCRQYSVISD